MSKHTLPLSPDLSLPIDAATQTFAFIGRKGSGKTYAAGKLVELLVGAAVQVVILDTVGNWYGLRQSADGRGRGLDVPIFGGLRKDYPLEAHAGEMVADVVVDTGRSVVLDVSQFSQGDRKKFATAFGERLWARKKAETHPTPVHLVLEECQLIVPQHVGTNEARMVGIYEEIVRLGRNYGIGASMLSQRPQSVNKEVLNQTECLLCFQTNGPQERDALKKWVTQHDVDVDLVDELPGLKVGTCWLWSPQWLGVLKKITIAAKATFDATSTPTVGGNRVRRDPAPIDLKDFAAKMAVAVERAKENDPKALRAQVAQLKTELAKVQAQKPPAAKVETRTVEKPVLKERQLARVEKLAEALSATFDRAEKQLAELNTARLEISRAGMAFKTPAAAARVAPAASSAVVSRNRPAVSQNAPLVSQNATLLHDRPVTAEGVNDAPAVGRGMLRRILIAMAQRPGLTNRQVGVRAGCSSQSGTFSNNLGIARKWGWIADDGDRRSITPAGLAALGEYEALPTGRGLLEYWLAELGQSAASRMLRTLAAAYPAGLSHAQIGEGAGVSHESGTFSNNMGRLRALELITSAGRGLSVASEELFD